MSDQFGFIEGAKSVTGSMDASREASKSITKSIVDVQKDAAAVAQQKDLERKRHIKESQMRECLLILFQRQDHELLLSLVRVPLSILLSMHGYEQLQ